MSDLSVRFTLRLPADLAAAVRQGASAQGVWPAARIRELIAAGLRSEHAGEDTTQRSSVTLRGNREGGTSWEVRVIAGEEPALLDVARTRAISAYRALRDETAS